MIRFIALLVLVLPLLARADLGEAVQAYGEGDYKKALAGFKELAGQNDVEGQYFLGFFYHNGYGVERNQAEAIKWFLKAANQGNARSQYYVGIMSAKGEGVAKDPVAGYMWLAISALNPTTKERDKHYTMEEMDKVAKKLKPEDVQKAIAMAKAWKPGS
jgi:uncharacterized protein